MAHQQSTEAITCRESDRDTLRLVVDVKPFTENIGGPARIHSGEAVASVQQRLEPDCPACAGRPAKTVDRLIEPAAALAAWRTGHLHRGRPHDGRRRT